MKLSLGTAQFGSNYGLANHQGKISQKEAESIIKTAQLAGIRSLDTAVSYGLAEEVLGNIGIDNFDCVSKLPPIPKNTDNVKTWVNMQVEKSAKRLGLSRLFGMLLHYPEDILSSKGEEYCMALLEAKNKGYIENIGFSIYSPEILDQVTQVFWPDIVQVPFNIFDQRIRVSGWLSRLVDGGTKIHARSVFLQGLLLMQKKKIPNYFDRWNEDLKSWNELVASKNISHMEYALNFVAANDNIDKVIVGVDNCEQLLELITAYNLNPDLELASLEVNDLDLIDPSKWHLS